MKKHSWLKIGLISLAIAVSVLIAAEITVRLIAASSNIFNINIGAALDSHPTRGTQLKANYRADGVSINSFGILGPEITLLPDPAGIRILIIGDSTSYHPTSRNFSRVLEDKLKDFFPNGHIEVIAGAVPGYNSGKALDWYNEFLHRLNPDMAILFLGWNDILSIHPFNKTELFRRNPQARSFLLKLYIVRLPYYFMRACEKKRGSDLSPLSSEEIHALQNFYPAHYAQNLTSLIGKLKSRGVSVYLVTLPGLVTYDPIDDEIRKMYYGPGMKNKLAIYQSIYGRYQEVLLEVARHTGTPTIDLRKLIKSSDRRRVFTDTMHFDAAGAELFGREMADAVRTDAVSILTPEKRNSKARCGKKRRSRWLERS